MQVHALRMTNDILTDLEAHGFATRTTDLTARGHSPRTIGRAIERGTLLRVCRGWVATSMASQLSIIAIAQGGKLTGTSALASRGTWSGEDRRIHIQVPVNGHGPAKRLTTPIRVFVRPKYAPGQVVRHWAPERHHDRAEPPWRVSVIDALVEVAKDSTSEQFIACVDSALHNRTLSRAGLPTLFSLLPLRFRPLQHELDGSAESGLESICRVLLRPLVRSIETQVRIPGIARGGGDGRVDLLIDGWLVIELDGDEYHDPKVDRGRNATLVRLGYRIHRFGYDQIINQWPEVEATILELLRYPPPGPRRS